MRSLGAQILHHARQPSMTPPKRVTENHNLRGQVNIENTPKIAAANAIVCKRLIPRISPMSTSSVTPGTEVTGNRKAAAKPMVRPTPDTGIVATALASQPKEPPLGGRS